MVGREAIRLDFYNFLANNHIKLEKEFLKDAIDRSDSDGLQSIMSLVLLSGFKEASQARHVLSPILFDYYYRWRTHLSLEMDTPESRLVQRSALG